jgi:hypothetical protein
MRVHIDMDKALLERVDEVAGERGRSQFIRDSVLAALASRERLEALRASAGSIDSSGHAWDEDPGLWVRSQRRGDQRRVG